MTIEKAISTNWFNQRGHFQITRRLNTTTQFWKCAANQSADLTHPYYWLSFSNFTNLVSDRLTLLSHRPTGAAIPKAVAAIAVWENQITSVVTCPLCLTSRFKRASAAIRLSLARLE
jgi:phage major head subunit gpT-like protein